jgi:lysyl-tRNA synthetase class 2
LALLTVGAAAAALSTGIPWPALAPVLLTGTWMLAKDWRDLTPSRRDTTIWRVAFHRRARPLRDARKADWLPPVAGILMVVVGLLNLVSTLTPDLDSRARLLRNTFPDEIPRLAHAFALPAGVALVVLGFYLARRRRRAWLVAVAALAVAGVLNLLKGLDVEEASACWALAILLAWSRPAFWVRHETEDGRASVKLAARVLVVSFLSVLLAVAAAARSGSPHLGARLIPAQLAGLLTFNGGPVHYPESLEWIPVGVGLVEIGAIVACGFLLFRPLRSPRGFPKREARLLARRIIDLHGSDTLSFFKLRNDNHYFFDSTSRAFLAYRVQNGVLLVSGDPVGPSAALSSLLREFCAFAEARSLRVGAVGASEAFASLAREAGLRSFYIGDEAIVDVGAFSLEGRSMRKVRQSVARLERAGYGSELASLGALDRDTLAQLEVISERWRGGRPERGFSMALEGLRGIHLADSSVVIAHDADGLVRGFLHFVPVSGRPVLSLNFMRGDRDTPNGLMEFLVVRSIQACRGCGIRELSLNFAAFARLMHSPSGRAERVLGKLASVANPYFQIESLYSFNAKFGPRWAPRYLLYEGALGLPMTGLSAIRAEGQLPIGRGRPARQAQVA